MVPPQFFTNSVVELQKVKKKLNDTLFVACFGLNRNRMKRETGDFDTTS